MDLQVTPWSKPEPPTEEEVREMLAEQDLRVYRWSNTPHDKYAAHTHGYHKIIYVLDGNIRFDFPTRNQSLNLSLGDRLDVPSGLRHSATIGESGVVCLEAHVY